MTSSTRRGGYVGPCNAGETGLRVNDSKRENTLLGGGDGLHEDRTLPITKAHTNTVQGALQAFFLLLRGPSTATARPHYGPASSRGKTHLRANSSSYEENSVRLMTILTSDGEGADRRCSGPILTRTPCWGGPGALCSMARGSPSECVDGG